MYDFVPIGTPCLVHDEKAKGSQLPFNDDGNTAGCKSAWMIADGMYREQVLFWNPRTNRTVKSKAYTAFTLRRGLNFEQMVGVKMPADNARMKPIPGDMNELITIQLPEMKENIEAERQPDGNPIAKMKHFSLDNNITAPQITQVITDSELGGSVRLKDHLNRDMEVNVETGTIELIKANDDHECERHVEDVTQVTLCISLEAKLTVFIHKHCTSRAVAIRKRANSLLRYYLHYQCI